MTPTPPSSGNPVLLRKIADAIRDGGPMPFADFMDLALHDAEHGYYAAGGRRLGRGGDFFTASDVGDLFGACVASQLVELDAALGRPDPFHAVEFGAGRGLLAADVVAAVEARAPSFARRLRYVAVDRSRGMRRDAAAAAAPFDVESPGTAMARGAGRKGCVLAVELFDALPVHRVRRRGERLVEIRVDVRDLDGEPRLVEVEVDPSPDVAAEASRRGAAPVDGHEAEVRLADGPCLADLGRVIADGYLLAVDYGHDTAELHGPTHARGTLLAYHRHTTNEEYLARVGEQDLTAHVDFGALVDAACGAGWKPVARTTQDRFLIRNGILDAFEQDAADWSDPARVKRRLQAMQLIHPTGMGRTFHVLAFRKGADAGPALAGFADPFARRG